MKRKLLAACMAATFAMTSLTGCGGSQESAQDTTKQNAQTADTTEAVDAAKPENEAQAAEKIHLTVPKVGYNKDQINTANAKEGGPTYEDRYYMTVTENLAKNLPDYEMEYVDWGWGETLDQKQRALFAAGSAPDIVAGETFIPSYAAEGLLEPLPQEIVDLVNPSFLVYDNDGKAVAVAYKSSIFMIFYNKALLQQCGYTEDDIPETWAEWKAMSDDITAQGQGEFWGGGIPTFPNAGGALRATPFFRANGTDFAVDGKINLDDAKLQEVLSFIREMNYNFPAGLGNGSDEFPMWDAFHEGKLAFVVQGSFEGSDAENAGMDWGVAPIPMNDAGIDGNCTVGSVYLAVPKDAANKEASFNVIKETLSLENEKVWLEGSYCPAIKEIIEDPSYYENDKVLMMEMQVIKDGTYSGLASFPKNDSAIWEIINQNVLARTTMTEDPIDVICSEAQEQILPLQQ